MRAAPSKSKRDGGDQDLSVSARSPSPSLGRSAPRRSDRRRRVFDLLAAARMPALAARRVASSICSACAASSAAPAPRRAQAPRFGACSRSLGKQLRAGITLSLRGFVGERLSLREQVTSAALQFVQVIDLGDDSSAQGTQRVLSRANRRHSAVEHVADRPGCAYLVPLAGRHEVFENVRVKLVRRRERHDRLDLGACL